MTINVPFNKPYLTGNELSYIEKAVKMGKISGNGYFTKKCQQFFEENFGFNKCLLTSSCTDALEMAAILLDIKSGDEVIVPSYTFVSSANAFVLRGAKIVFLDSLEDHPGMDVDKIESLISPKTKAIVVVHYAGVPVDMAKVMDLANRFSIKVVEDAAQAIDISFQGKALGGVGHLGTFSFHETKNLQCGEGGMLTINDPGLKKRAEIIWEKGTDRAAFFRGEVNKYGWVDLGSSFLPSEVTAAFLWAQLENLQRIQSRRSQIWHDYSGFLASLDRSYIPKIQHLPYLELLRNELDKIQEEFSPIVLQKDPGNYHMFYMLFPSLESRTKFSESLKSKGILSVFHYQALHQSEFIKAYQGIDNTPLPNAEIFADTLLRLPFFYELPEVSSSCI
ncbi:dTDP-4-amino-4,6-dideoxygalactose transaminase [Algoriphagus aestuariicola]|uniref:dTDP-4-amino-4,6-dideoxygalactose transaminase n=1 Tax=Algoriphagus aestuariicola TaxID=1852016 RepID=UPI001F49936D|nr:dTDP-4-amino-4,6-dideoxygalactose transaminase [Algoriphagus aestuariicola]